jgi:hypothetical protein
LAAGEQPSRNGDRPSRVDHVVHQQAGRPRRGTSR